MYLGMDVPFSGLHTQSMFSSPPWKSVMRASRVIARLKYRLMCTSSCSRAYARRHPNVPNLFRPWHFCTAWCAFRKNKVCYTMNCIHGYWPRLALCQATRDLHSIRSTSASSLATDPVSGLVYSLLYIFNSRLLGGREGMALSTLLGLKPRAEGG